MNGLCTDIPVTLLYNMDRTWPEPEKEEIIGLAECLENALCEEGHPVTVACLVDKDLEGMLSAFDPEQSIVFNWCEEVPGIRHSAGLVAQILERTGFAFTGAGSQALEFSYDKPGVKQKMTLQKVPTPFWQIFDTAETSRWDRFPAIVKPSTEHCSFGITSQAVVHNPEELSARVGEVLEEFHQPALVEDFIDGREFHVTIVGNGRLQVLPISEMDFSTIRDDRRRLCTYDSKFVPGSNDYEMIQLRLPAELTAGQQRRLEEVSLAAYKAAGCRDYARLDVRLRDDIFYILDINPNADISPDTSVALSAEMAGYPYGRLASLLVNLAAKRHARLSRLVSGKARTSVPVLVPAG